MIIDKHTIPILVIEDSLDDFMVMKRAFREVGLSNPLSHFRKAEQALDFLFARGEYTGRAEPLPGIILADLNLPGMDGVELLSVLKADPELHRIPVVVMTTSDDQRDVARCYDAGANSYVHKPVDLHGFVDALLAMKHYWLEVAVLPPAHPPCQRLR